MSRHGIQLLDPAARPRWHVSAKLDRPLRDCEAFALPAGWMAHPLDMRIIVGVELELDDELDRAALGQLVTDTLKVCAPDDPPKWVIVGQQRA
jgi:hypothetical protein